MTANENRLKTKDVAKRPGEMVKPAEIIGIPGMEGWTLADRRTWNLLLMNAWSDRLEDPSADFTIPLRELRGLHDSNDRLRRSLRTLQTTLVDARMPDGALRTVQMLGGTDISDSDREHGVLKYDFHRKLVPLLRESDIYARMDVKILNAFTSKYGLALYEALAARINLRRTTEELDIGTLRQWLGVENGKLDEWYDLNRKAGSVALAGCRRARARCLPIRPRGRTPGGRGSAAPACRWRARHAPVPWPASPSPRRRPASAARSQSSETRASALSGA